jgi:hypothetical protein
LELVLDLEWRRWEIGSIESEDLDKIESLQKAYGGCLECADMKTIAEDSNPMAQYTFLVLCLCFLLEKTLI